MQATNLSSANNSRAAAERAINSDSVVEVVTDRCLLKFNIAGPP